MLVTLYKISEVLFHLFGRNGFHVKAASCKGKLSSEPQI